MTEREEAEELWGHESGPDLYVALGIDQGGTSGWSVMGIHPDAMESDPDIRVMANVMFWSAGEFTGDEHSQVDELAELVESWPSARLVMERFVLRKNSMDPGMLSPVRIGFAVEHRVRPRYFVLQQPSLAMTTVTDDRLRDMGLWIPGKEHARDATKHVVTFLKRVKERAIKAGQILGR